MEDVLFKTDGTEMNVQPKNERDYSLEELQKYVGGYIEIVHLFDKKRIMVVNEEGAINGMQLNLTASRFAIRPIFGDVLVCSSDRVK